MEGREALRRYFEQRKGLGETELVLETLSVEEAMGIVGAALLASSREAEPSADWRSTIRAAGGAPPARPSLGTPAVSENVANVPSPPETVGPIAAPQGPGGGASARVPFDESVGNLETLEVVARAVAAFTK